MRKVIKRDGSKEIFNFSKIYNAVDAAFVHCNRTMPEGFKSALESTFKNENPRDINGKLLPLTVESIQDRVQNLLFKHGYQDVYNEYLIYRYEHKVTREYVKSQRDFIDRYIQSDNNANATIDDNSNVASKNIGTLNSEIHKPWNIKISRGMVMDMLKILYPDFDHKQYIRDLAHHIIYKHDESTYAGPIAPYCCSISMYPFITGGIKHIGGLSACPHSLMSFCGIYINLIFAISGQFAGAVATSEFFVYFDYFARKEWGDDYYKRTDELVGKRTLHKLIHQYFQQVVYSINQPAAARGMQSAFVNFSYFDKPFFDGMFGNFMFPDGTKACWESVNWLQRDFMQWFNEERLRCMLTFPVESFALVYKDGHFVDQDSADFVAAEYARGHSFFTYISDSVDSLSSCCFNGDEIIKIKDKNGNNFSTSISDFVNSISSSVCPSGKKIGEKTYFIDSFNKNGGCKEVQITGVLKKQYCGKMYKICVDENKYITVTPDHILMVRNRKGNILSLPAEDVVRNPDDYELVVD